MQFVCSMPDYEIAVRELTSDDGRALQQVCESSADYFELATGLPPGGAEAQSLFVSLPPGKDYDSKILLGIFRGDSLIGVGDVIRDHPDPATWTIGVLLIVPEQRGLGIGTRVYEAFEAEAQAQGATRLRVNVPSVAERGRSFWAARGFAPTDGDGGADVEMVRDL